MVDELKRLKIEHAEAVITEIKTFLYDHKKPAVVLAGLLGSLAIAKSLLPGDAELTSDPFGILLFTSINLIAGFCPASILTNHLITNPEVDIREADDNCIRAKTALDLKKGELKEFRRGLKTSSKTQDVDTMSNEL